MGTGLDARLAQLWAARIPAHLRTHGSDGHSILGGSREWFDLCPVDESAGSQSVSVPTILERGSEQPSELSQGGLSPLDLDRHVALHFSACHSTTGQPRWGCDADYARRWRQEGFGKSASPEDLAEGLANRRIRLCLAHSRRRSESRRSRCGHPARLTGNLPGGSALGVAAAAFPGHPRPPPVACSPRLCVLPSRQIEASLWDGSEFSPGRPGSGENVRCRPGQDSHRDWREGRGQPKDRTERDRGMCTRGGVRCSYAVSSWPVEIRTTGHR